MYHAILYRLHSLIDRRRVGAEQGLYFMSPGVFAKDIEWILVRPALQRGHLASQGGLDCFFLCEMVAVNFTNDLKHGSPQ